jgi:hypothetical protein
MLSLFNFLWQDEVNPRNYLFPLRQKYLPALFTSLKIVQRLGQGPG